MTDTVAPSHRPSAREGIGARAEAATIVSRLRQATPNLVWSSLAVGMCTTLLHLLVPMLGSECPVPAHRYTLPAPGVPCAMAAGDGGGEICSGDAAATEMWQVSVLRWSVVALRVCAAGLFGSFVSCLVYSVRASTYWQLSILSALDAAVRSRVEAGRYVVAIATQ